MTFVGSLKVKKLFFSVFAIFFALAGFSYAASKNVYEDLEFEQSEVPKAAIIAAGGNLQLVRDLVRRNPDLKLDGDVRRFRLGRGRKIYVVDREKFEKEGKIVPMDTGIWEFVTEINGVAESFIAVMLEPGTKDSYKYVNSGGDSKGFVDKLRTYESSRTVEEMKDFKLLKMNLISGEHYLLDCKNSLIFPCFDTTGKNSPISSYSRGLFRIGERDERESCTFDEFAEFLKAKIAEQAEQRSRNGYNLYGGGF